jgi:hypothetical protein
MEALASTKGSRHHDRLFSLAMSKFDFAIRATPDNLHMLVEYGDMLARFAVLKTNAHEEALLYFEKAVLKYSLARHIAGLSELGMLLGILFFFSDGFLSTHSISLLNLFCLFPFPIFIIYLC